LKSSNDKNVFIFLLVEVCYQLELILRDHGTPRIIQTDQGTEFQGLFDELCNKRHIQHIRSRAYHPESQGKVNHLVYFSIHNILEMNLDRAFESFLEK